MADIESSSSTQMTSEASYTTLTTPFSGPSQAEIEFEQALNMVVVPAMFCLITVVGVTGNAAVIIVIMTRRKMHSLVNYLLLNLACGDLAFVTLCVPFMAYHYVSLSWELGEPVCKMAQYVLYVTVYLTMYTLVCVAVARYFVIAYSDSLPVARRLHSARFASFCVVCLWLVMLLANTPILSLYELREHNGYVYCGLNDVERGQRLFVIFFFCAYLCPLLLLAVAHASISRYLSKKLDASSSSSAEAQQQGPGRKSLVNARERNDKVSRLLLSIVVVFAACWLPMHLLLILSYFKIVSHSWQFQVHISVATAYFVLMMLSLNKHGAALSIQ